MKSIKSRKARWDIRMREIITFWAAIYIFPFKTIRALIWRWERWLIKVDREIDEDHTEYLRIMKYKDDQRL